MVMAMVTATADILMATEFKFKQGDHVVYARQCYSEAPGGDITIGGHGVISSDGCKDNWHDEPELVNSYYVQFKNHKDYFKECELEFSCDTIIDVSELI